MIRTGMTREAAMAQVSGAFNGLIGNDNAQRVIRARITSALITGNPMPFILLTGRTGIGKTAFASAAARAIGWDFAPVLCGEITTEEMLEKIIFPQHERYVTEQREVWYPGLDVPVIEDVPIPGAAGPTNKVVFFDEMEAMGRRATGVIYRILERRTIQVGATRTGLVKSNFEIAIIGASNVERGLTDAVESRFDLKIKLNEYSSNELIKMGMDKADLTDYEFTMEAIHAMLAPSQRTPGLLMNLIESVESILFAEGADCHEPVEAEAVKDALNALGFLPCGLHRTGMEYLDALQGFGGQAGLKTLAAVLSEDEKDLRLKMEPWLVRSGFIHLGPGGRRLTKRGAEFHMAHGKELLGA